MVDVVSEAAPEASEPIAPAGARFASFVPPPTHTHAYPVPLDHDAHPHDPSLVHLPVAPPLPMPEVTAVAAPARFTIVVTSDSLHGPVGAAPARAGKPAGADGDAVPLPEEGVSSPARPSTPISPAYPAEARAQEVEADVVLGIVVASTGEVLDAHVLEPVGFGFDESALLAVRAARFVPAERDGRRVAVRMRWSVAFRLR